MFYLEVDIFVWVYFGLHDNFGDCLFSCLTLIKCFWWLHGVIVKLKLDTDVDDYMGLLSTTNLEFG